MVKSTRWLRGSLAVGGFTVGDAAVGEVKNHPTVARISSGAIVEREVPHTMGTAKTVTLQLKSADFTTAARLAKVINMNLGGVFAQASDSGTVAVNVPPPYAKRQVEFLALIERLEVTPDSIARVVVNERTGTIIMGQDVRISPVAIAHGNITVSIKTENTAVPAAPLTPGGGQNQANTNIQVTEEKRNLIEVQGANLAEVVEGLNRLGTSSRDLITILQAIKQAGSARSGRGHVMKIQPTTTASIFGEAPGLGATPQLLQVKR